MQQVSTGIDVLFIIATLFTVYQFYLATYRSKYFLFIVISWMAIQLLLGFSGFYTFGHSMPPRFFLMPLPPVIGIIILFFTPAGRKFIDSADARKLTLLHSVRIVVETVFYFLLLAKTIPVVMTFEGRNFDIVAGLTAPVIYFMAFRSGAINTKLLVMWNILSLLLLVNIVVIAVVSLPTPFQRFGLEQPNMALSHFPYNWLPAVVVPLVLFSHLIVLRQLIVRHSIAGKPIIG